MIHLINMCNKFVALNILLAKLSDPKARIYPDDLHCLDFKEFGTIPADADEDLFWALRNLSDQAEDLLTTAPGTRWREYEDRRKTRERLEILEKKIKKVESGQKCPAPWEI